MHRIHRAILADAPAFAGADQRLAIVRRAGEPYTFGFDPAARPGYVAARGLTPIEDVRAGERAALVEARAR